MWIMAGALRLALVVGSDGSCVLWPVSEGMDTIPVRVTLFLPRVGGSACASRPLCRPPRGGTTPNFQGLEDRKIRVLVAKGESWWKKQKYIYIYIYTWC